MRISDWSSDVCSSDLQRRGAPPHQGRRGAHQRRRHRRRATDRRARRPRPRRLHQAVGWQEAPRPGEAGSVAAAMPILIIAVIITAVVQGLVLGTHWRQRVAMPYEIGGAHVWTPVTNAKLGCRLL